MVSKISLRSLDSSPSVLSIRSGSYGRDEYSSVVLCPKFSSMPSVNTPTRR